MEHRDKDHVQHDVDERSHNQEIQRTFGITRRTQDIGAHIVQNLGNHAQKVDAQIQRRIPQDFIGCSHQTQYRLGREQPHHREYRTDDHAEYQRRMYLAVYGVHITGAVTLCHYNARTAAQADKKPYQQIDKCAGSTDGRQSIGADEVADDQCIGGVVQLLEQRAEPDRQKEDQQLAGNAAGQDVRLFDSTHNETCFSPLLYSLRTYFML